MKNNLNFITFAILFLNICHISAQIPKEITKDTLNFIKSVNFNDNKIKLDGKLCFIYKKDGNNFSINNIEDRPVFTGTISSDEFGNFSSIITFENEGIRFSNKKIIGRNDLILSLVDNYVIDSGCNFNKENLSVYFKYYNQLNGY